MYLQHLAQDLRTAWRGLTRAKAFTAAVVLTLTTGIAATALMFALIDGVLLRPLPIRNQDRVIVAWKELRASQFAHYPFGGPDVKAVGDASGLIERSAGVSSNGAGPWVAVENGTATFVSGVLVTGGFFDVLGVEPILGRALAETDDREGAEAVVVISDALWQRRYGRSPDVLDRKVRLGDVPFAIVGVMPSDLGYPRGVELWRTAASVPTGGPFGDSAQYEIDLVARLRPDVSVSQVSQELQALTRRLESAAPPDFPRGLIPIVRPFGEVVVGDVRPTLLMLFAAVGLVLLISSANAANLLLIRAEGRQRELAMRTALGAGRGRIAAQLLSESVLVALAAGAAGIALARVSLGALVAVLPTTLPRIESVHVDARVGLFTIGIAFVTALLTALAPARASVRADLLSQLRRGGSGSRPAAARRLLAAAQVALAISVLSLAGLLTRSVLKLQSVDTGLAVDGLVLVDLALPLSIVQERTTHERFLEELMTRLKAVPLIAAATVVNVPPFSGDGGWDVPRFTAEGQPPERAATNRSLNLESVFPTYFETFGIAIRRGRGLNEGDRAGAPAAAVVSADVAERTWPGQDPIGKRVKMGGPESEDEWRTVVGVAAPTRYRELENERPTLYLPAAQFLITARILVLRSAAPVGAVAAAVREQVARTGGGAQVVRIAPFAESLRAPLARPRFAALILGVFALAAVAQATIGLYAVVAAHIRQRQREIGIRMALGASISNVRQLVMGDALRLALGGACVGLGASMLATRFVRGMLFDLNPLDPATLGGAVLVLIAAAAAAAYPPMRRATRLDPAITLRTE